MEDGPKAATEADPNGTSSDAAVVTPAAGAVALAGPLSKAPPGGPVAPPRPSLPSSFPADRWVPAGRAPRAGVLGSALAAAILGATTVTLSRPGVGWLLTGLAVVAVAGAASVEFRRRPGIGRCLWAAAAVGLLAIGTVRAAGWLFALCVPMAAVCAVQALIGGASTRVMLAGVVAGPVAALRALPWAGRGARGLAPRTGSAGIGRLIASAAVSVLLLLVFGALFASADRTFARLLARLIPDLDRGAVPRWAFLFAVVALTALAIAYLVAAPPWIAEPGEPRRPLRVLEWALPVALLDALFAAFVLVQITVLFGGRDHVLGPGGPNFAQYARGGFWQLLAVTGLTLGVIGVVARAASRTGRADRVAIRLLVGVLAGLTLVIVASALTRLALYEEAYGYTRLRLLVATTELWLGLLFVLILAAGVRLRARWLPRAVLGTAVAALLGLAALNPDRFIAAQNVDRFHRTGKVDVWYLSNLSPDAAPELAKLPDQERACALMWIARDLRSDRDTWHSYNAGRSRARALPAPAPCELP
jgi:hypothetical protein